MTTCVSCAQALPEGARFCLHCGQEQAAPPCAGCGAALVPGARFCMECGTPVAAPAATADGPGPVASRRLTSILFGDLVGFTTLSEARDTEDVRELLARYFEECRRIVERYGGTIEKFIGDAVMAVWGVPVSQEDDAERAVRAGLELVAAVTQFGEEVGAPELAMRVGVVTGEVAVTVGATQQGMVAGDPVNTAARVQSAAAPGQVWVDETTRLLTTAAISYVDVGSHALKGKVDPVPLWAVRAVVAAVGGAQRADGLEAPLVGRDRELRLVKELFHRAEESRRPVLLVVEGEAGVGKSRLAWEFEKYVDGLNTFVRWHSTRSVAYGEGVAYFAVAEAVRGRLRALADDPEVEEDIAVQLERGLERYVPEADRDWIRPRLGTLLGIGSVGTFVRDELFSAWTAWFEAVAEDEALVLVVDDAQDADEGTLLFVEHLTAQARVPLFLLLVTRSGLITSRPSLITRPGANVMNLDTLSSPEMAKLFEGLVPGLPESARGQLVERAEGVPLFAVETIRSLIDRDLVVPRGGEYVLADGVALDADAMTAPASLHALVAARLDTLSAPQRYVVDRASVLGQTFSPDALAGVCPDVRDLGEVLAQLVHLQILSLETSRMSSEYGQYRFVQSVVRQVAYGTLSRRDRKAVHLAVVTTLEATGAEGDDTAAIRAQHYLDAADAVPTDDDVAALRAAALENLRRAAARALSLGSPAESARHLRAALGLTDDPGERGRVLADLSWSEADGGSYAEAMEHAREAMALLEEVGDRVEAGRAAAVVATALSVGHGNHEGAVAAAQPWWDELKNQPDAQVAQMALSRSLLLALGRLHLPFQEVAEARMRIAEREGDQGALSETYNMLSVHYSNAGIPSLGDVLLTASADIARSTLDLPRLGHILTNQAAGQLAQDLSRASEAAQEAIEVCRRSGSHFALRFALANQALALWHVGRWDDLDELRAAGTETPGLVDETVEVALAQRAAARGTSWEPRPFPELEDVDDQQVTGWRAFLEGAVAAVEGDTTAALTHVMDAVEVFYADSGVWDDLPHAWIEAARLALAAGDDATLDRLVAIVEDEAARVPPALNAHHCYVLGTRAAHRGDPEAEASLRRAIELYTGWGSRPCVARAQAELARHLAGTGHPDEAATLLDQARATYTDLGATRWLAELDQAVTAR